MLYGFVFGGLKYLAPRCVERDFMSEADENIAFSPILIMEFIRQVVVARSLAAESAETVVRFKISKPLYDEMRAFPLQVQFIRLYPDYDEVAEILTVKTDETLLARFREQKSLVEIAGKYEGQYAERYKKFIEIME